MFINDISKTNNTEFALFADDSLISFSFTTASSARKYTHLQKNFLSVFFEKLKPK